MTKYWHSEGESSLRRYGACGPPYQVIPSRLRYPPESIRRSSRNYALPSQEAVAPESDQDSERDTKESRRRIPVACGRCRKRKIRCSGPQNDDSCLNCRNAGNADCQFNRVASEELGFKSSLEFGYNPELARAVHARGTLQPNSYRSPTPNYNYAPVSIPTNLPTLYRNQNTTDYQFEPKNLCSLPPLNTDFNEDGYDYTVPATNYPLYGQEPVGGLSSYSSYGPGRIWLSGTQSTRGSLSNIYYGSDSSPYGPQQVHYNNHACGFRPSLSADANIYSFSDMNSSLPVSDATNNHPRVLPVLSPNKRNNSGLGPSSRTMNGMSYSISSDSTTSNQLMAGGHSAPLSFIPNSDNPDSVDGYGFNSITENLSQAQTDMYDSGNNWSPLPLTTTPALHSNTSTSEVYQRECNEAPRKASQSSQSALTTRHSSLSDLYTDDSGDVSQKTSKNSTQNTLRSSLRDDRNALSDIYYSHCHETTRKASQSGQSTNASSKTTPRSHSGSHSQDRPIVPRTSSMIATDVARTQRSHQ